MTYIIYPEYRNVSAADIAMWFSDAVESGEIAPEYFGAKTEAEMAAALSDAGLITVGRPRSDGHLLNEYENHSV
jgi:hypothetical protein